MKRQNSFKALLATAGVLAVAGAAQAQSGPPPGMMQGMPPEAQAQMQAQMANRGGGGSFSAPGGSAAGAGATGAISNVESIESTTTTTQFDTDAEGGTLPDTGGAQLLFVLAGALTAGSALLMRRKLLS